VSGAHDEARRILTERRELLEQVTRRLLEKEVMDGEELRAMMAPAPATQEPDQATAPAGEAAPA